MALVAAFACVGGGDSARFDVTYDDRAMAAVPSRWTGAELDLSGVRNEECRRSGATSA